MVDCLKINHLKLVDHSSSIEVMLKIYYDLESALMLAATSDEI